MALCSGLDGSRAAWAAGMNWKAARLGGNVALLTPRRVLKGGYFGLQDYMTADVYRCEK